MGKQPYPAHSLRDHSPGMIRIPPALPTLSSTQPLSPHFYPSPLPLLPTVCIGTLLILSTTFLNILYKLINIPLMGLLYGSPPPSPSLPSPLPWADWSVRRLGFQCMFIDIPHSRFQLPSPGRRRPVTREKTRGRWTHHVKGRGSTSAHHDANAYGHG